jgi:hypothetical protein
MARDYQRARRAADAARWGGHRTRRPMPVAASEPVSFSVADAGIVPADILGDLVNA